jgi:hypothetical protein
MVYELVTAPVSTAAPPPICEARMQMKTRALPGDAPYGEVAQTANELLAELGVALPK